MRCRNSTTTVHTLVFAPLLAQLSRQAPGASNASAGEESLAGLHDIVGPVQIPGWWTTPAGMAAITLGAIALLVSLYFLWARIRARSAIVIPPTPWEKAIAALGQARLQLGKVEPDEFVALVSTILRTYISEQFGLRAREQTSQEFLAALSGSARFNEGERRVLASFLEYCDLIKFAHEPAGEAECNRLLDEAVQFVNQSTPIAEPAASGR